MFASHRTARSAAPFTLALVGPHGAGKTTLGRRVAGLLGVPFDDEIGRRMRDEALARDPDDHVLASGPDFDRAVFAAERRRDRRRLGVARVVETWHVGNLAYAEVRSPEVVDPALAAVTGAHAAGHFGRVVVQPLTMSHSVALSRLSEPGPDAETLTHFFADVAARCPRIADQLDLERWPAIDTGLLDVDAAAAVVAERVRRTLRMPRRRVRRSFGAKPVVAPTNRQPPQAGA